MYLSKKGIENIRRGLIRSWKPGGSHDIRFRRKEIDSDTLRNRALDDRRGTFFAEIKKKMEDRFVTFTLLWSISGRRDQIDIFENGRNLVTIRPNKALEKIDEILS